MVTRKYFSKMKRILSINNNIISKYANEIYFGRWLHHLSSLFQLIHSTLSCIYNFVSIYVCFCVCICVSVEPNSTLFLSYFLPDWFSAGNITMRSIGRKTNNCNSNLTKILTNAKLVFFFNKQMIYPYLYI